ncbi:MAG: TA system VapC family ribonuclease toxin [Candidatus Methylacidiphilales bacterium]|nr:TA system VapC family ribonuclease toxin [Candidatus Methylacidiphilales bacterium]
MDIPDINVWLALVDQNHVHHASAVRYWEETADSQMAFTRVSMMGLLRLSTQPGVLSRTLTAAEAWRTYHQLMATPGVTYLAEPASLETRFAALTTETDLPRRLWTDAYLAAFAMAGGSRLVSFDVDFNRFPGLNFLCLQPV